MWLELQIFGFRALWSPYYLLFVIGLGIVYYLLTIRCRHKFTNETKPSGSQQIFFYLGLLLLYIVKGSPVDLVSHIMFTSHMIQMALYYLVFPIFIIKGIPVWIWKRVFGIRGLQTVLRILTKPLVALLLFNALFSMYHLPTVFDYAKSDSVVHAVISTIILMTAFFMWWPVFTPIKEQDQLSPLLKIGFIFANGVLITPACGLIIFSPNPLYDTYTEMGGWVQALSLCVPSDVLNGLSLSGPLMFSPMPVLHDQQLGGILMKISQEIIYGIILARIFFSWFGKDSEKTDPLPSPN
jgi:putative membrane protein